MKVWITLPLRVSVVHYSLRSHHGACVILDRLLRNALGLLVPWWGQRLELSSCCSVCIHYILLLLIHCDVLGIVCSLRLCIHANFLVWLLGLSHAILDKYILNWLRHAAGVGVAIPQVRYARKHTLVIALLVLVHVYLVVLHIWLLLLLALHVLVNLLLSAGGMSI